jgi:hypothetical protein
MDETDVLNKIENIVGTYLAKDAAKKDEAAQLAAEAATRLEAARDVVSACFTTSILPPLRSCAKKLRGMGITVEVSDNTKTALPSQKQVVDEATLWIDSEYGPRVKFIGCPHCGTDIVVNFHGAKGSEYESELFSLSKINKQLVLQYVEKLVVSRFAAPKA